MSDHCPACRVARELTEHRDACAVEWSHRRAALNFALILAKRACPDYRPARTTEEWQSDPDPRRTR